MSKSVSTAMPSTIAGGICIGLGVTWANSIGLPWWGAIGVAIFAGALGSLAYSLISRGFA